MQPFVPFSFNNISINPAYTNYYLQQNTMHYQSNLPQLSNNIDLSTLLNPTSNTPYLNFVSSFCQSLHSMFILNSNSIDYYNWNKAKEETNLRSCLSIEEVKPRREGTDEEKNMDSDGLKKQLFTSSNTDKCNQSYLLSKREKTEKKDAEIKKVIGATKKKKKTISRNSKCPHKSVKHYAKNMCSACYHAKGREKKAWNCMHSDEPHYALGLCQYCYQISYANSKKEKKEEQLNSITSQAPIHPSIY